MKQRELGSIKKVKKMSELAQELDAAADTTNDGNPKPDTNTTTQYTASRCSGSTALATNNSSSPNKRRSPDPNALKLDSQNQIPKKPKKLFLGPQANTISPSPPDFSKITLPCASSFPPDFSKPCASSAFFSGSTNPTHVNPQTRTTNPIPPLGRCHSDPYNPPGSDSVPGSGMGSASNFAPQSPPDNYKMVGATAVTTLASKATASLPPLPRMLTRSVSESSPNKSDSRSSSSNYVAADGSPHFKRLKRLRDSMKEMKQEEDKATEDNTTNAVKAGSEIEGEDLLFFTQPRRVLTTFKKSRLRDSVSDQFNLGVEVHQAIVELLPGVVPREEDIAYFGDGYFDLLDEAATVPGMTWQAFLGLQLTIVEELGMNHQ